METIQIDDLEPNPRQIRKEFNEKGINRMAKSINKYGILVPILAVKIKEGKNKGKGMIVAGERRWRAAKKTGVKELKLGREVLFIDDELTKTKKGFNQDIDTINALENIMRERVNIFEEADGLVRILTDYTTLENIDEMYSTLRSVYLKVYKDKKKAEEIEDIVEGMGISLARAVKLVSIFKLDKKAREYILERSKKSRRARYVNISHIYEISKLPQKHQLMLAKGVIQQGCSSTSIVRIYREWKDGIRDNHLFIIEKKEKKEIAKHNLWYEKREKLIADMRRKTIPEKQFHWLTLQADMSMILNDLNTALDFVKKENNLPLGFEVKLSALAGKCRELEEKIRNK